MIIITRNVGNDAGRRGPMADRCHHVFANAEPRDCIVGEKYCALLLSSSAACCRPRRRLFSAIRIAAEKSRDRKRGACSQGGKEVLAPLSVSHPRMESSEWTLEFVAI